MSWYYQLMNRETKTTNHYLTIASLNKAFETAHRMFMKIKHRGLWRLELESVMSSIRKDAKLDLLFDFRKVLFRRNDILSSTS
jgi:hypothetical protein